MNRNGFVRSGWPLLLVLLVGLVLRLALWDNLPRQGFISDEAEYLAAADWLAQGRGFAWHIDWLWTRAPLYPLFIAAHMWLFGFSVTPIYITQTLLSLVNIALVYLLARQIAHNRTGWLWHTGFPALAALFAALYLPFAAYPQMILSETLYMTLLLSACALLGHWASHAQRARPAWQAAAFLGAAALLLGLATLTRGLTLGFLPLVLLWVWFVQRRHQRTLSARTAAPWLVALAFGVGCAVTILPWSVYASRTYGGVVLVDTTGAFNLLLGARTAYDGQRSDAPTRNFLLALLDEQLSSPERRELLADSCLLAQNDPRLLAALERPVTTITQAERQQLMVAEGLCLVRATPAAFVQKSFTELVDLFQINYTGSERFSGGFTLGRLPLWYTGALFVLDDTFYIVLLPLAVTGWGLAYRTTQHLPLTALIGLWWAYNILTAPLLFAINRFRIPLLPFACLFAAFALCWFIQQRSAKLRLTNATPRLASFGLLALLLTLIATTPYAYLQAAPSEWASYLGPYPSSLANTLIAWNARPTYLHEQEVIAALGRGDEPAARRLLAAQEVPTHTLRLAQPLLAGLAGQPAAGLALLPDERTTAATRDWQVGVVRGDLLRRLEDWDGTRAAFTPGYVDDENPVMWSWRWLYPAPTNQIDLGGNLDLGYITGFYLGEGDPSANGTFRWSSGEAVLLFPGQGSATPQQVCLRADGRGWPADREMPHFTLHLADAAPFVPLMNEQLERDVRVYCAPLPPVSAGDAVRLILQSETFVPGAADLLAQQGTQAGQLRLLGLRLDWVVLLPADAPPPSEVETP